MQTASVPYPLFPVSLIEVHERLGVIHALVGEYDAAMRHYEAAMTLLRDRDDAPLDDVVRLHHHIARVHEKRADFDTAFQWVERGLALAGAAESAEVVRCLLLGGALHQRQGRYQQALEWGARALHIATKLNSIRDQAHAYKLLGGTQRNLGTNEQALRSIERALYFYELVQDVDGLSNAQNDIANVYFELGRLSEAHIHYERSFELKKTIGDVYGQGMLACNLGELLRIQGNLSDAVTQYNLGLFIYEQIGSLYMTGVLHMNLGATYVLLGDLTTAEAHLQRSAELFDKANAEDFLPELERYRAELQLGRGRLEQAKRHCEISLLIAARITARVEEGATRRTLSHILAKSGDVQGAWQELEQSLALLRAAASPHEIARTLVVMAELAPLLNQRAAGQGALDEALPILRSVGAQRDIEEALRIAAQHSYSVADAMM